MDTPEHALCREGPKGEKVRIPAPVLEGMNLNAGALGCMNDELGLRCAGGNRLVDDHVQPSSRRLDGQRHMGSVGRGDDDQTDIVELLPSFLDR